MGGSSGGGGGSSGEVSWPEYLETRHREMIDELMDYTIPTMIASNPFVDVDAFDPDEDLNLAWDAVCEFDAFVDAMSHESDWESAMTKAVEVVDGQVITDSYINADIQAFSDTIEDELNTKALPQFKAGMRELNAVMSSAFVLGEADIYSRFTKEVAKYGTEVRSRLHLQRSEIITKSANAIIAQLLETGKLESSVASVSVDAKRIAIVARKEELDMNLEIDENEARWENEAWKYGANMLAAISGGTVGATGSKPSAGQSALSGALGGASIGATFGVPGAIVGGILGGVGGFLFN